MTLQIMQAQAGMVEQPPQIRSVRHLGLQRVWNASVHTSVFAQLRSSSPPPVHGTGVADPSSANCHPSATDLLSKPPPQALAIPYPSHHLVADPPSPEPHHAASMFLRSSSRA
uniref:Uncharacterized protein n=1 Tax=Oryza barthii TaxID=65489 RepID=A0A0D3HDZ7_9ORYZ